MKQACQQCPWRIENQGKPSPGGFYTKANLTRLWRQLRGGGHPQSCHLTDPSHPDHLIAGCRPDSKPQECTGSVILVRRELNFLASLGTDGVIDDDAVKTYLKQRKNGLKRLGIVYWLIERIAWADRPFFGKTKLPEIQDDPAIGLPKHICQKLTRPSPNATSPSSAKDQPE